jgi:hypothetical protein
MWLIHDDELLHHLVEACGGSSQHDCTGEIAVANSPTYLVGNEEHSEYVMVGDLGLSVVVRGYGGYSPNVL